MKFLSDSLDKISVNSLSSFGENAVGALGLAQRDWQKPYIMKTYLLYLLLNNDKVAPLYQNVSPISADDVVSLCLLTKISSEPILLKSIHERGIDFHTFFDNIKQYIIDNLKYISIELDEYKRKQTEKLEKANYNFFNCRMILKDYPLIRISEKIYLFSSYFYIQDAIFSRTIREITIGGNNTKVIGDAYEEVIYDSFQRMYSHCDVDQDSKKEILLNPKTKKNELCDILIKRGDKYLLIDCKAKELIEEIFQNNSSEIDTLIEKYKQRIKNYKNVQEGRFSKFIPESTSTDNIYSIIALMDDGTYSKNMLFDKHFNDLTQEEKSFFNKHIHIISFDDLLEAIVADADLIEVIQDSINDNTYDNHLSLNIKSKYRHNYNRIFEKWYKSATGKVGEFVIKNKLLG